MEDIAGIYAASIRSRRIVFPVPVVPKHHFFCNSANMLSQFQQESFKMFTIVLKLEGCVKGVVEIHCEYAAKGSESADDERTESSATCFWNIYGLICI